MPQACEVGGHGDDTRSKQHRCDLLLRFQQWFDAHAYCVKRIVIGGQLHDYSRKCLRFVWFGANAKTLLEELAGKDASIIQ